jgi:hypothetical protein
MATPVYAITDALMIADATARLRTSGRDERKGTEICSAAVKAVPRTT